MRKPFYWKARKAWFVKSEDGTRNIKLDANEEKAFDVWNEMRATSNPEAPTTPVAVIVQAYLQHSENKVAPSTHRSYNDYLVDFCNSYGMHLVRSLKPYHVTRWLDEHKTWGDASIRNAVTSLRICFNWAVREGLLPANPMAAVPRPRTPRREVLIDDDQHLKMMTAEDKSHGPKSKRAAAFRFVLIALRHSGARPGTVAAVRVEDISPDGLRWIVPEHKTRKKTEKPLIIYLSPCLATLTRIARGSRARGPLFRNARGEAWTSNAIRCRMRSLRKRLSLPEGVVAYSYRHTFTTNALIRGNDPATVAELLGHGDLKMIQEHYGHLSKASSHLSDAARKAVS